MSRKNERQAKAARRETRGASPAVPPLSRQAEIFRAITGAVNRVHVRYSNGRDSRDGMTGNCVLYAHVGSNVLTAISGCEYVVTGGHYYGMSVHHAWCKRQDSRIIADFSLHELSQIMVSHGLPPADIPAWYWGAQSALYKPDPEITQFVTEDLSECGAEMRQASLIALESLSSPLSL